MVDGQNGLTLGNARHFVEVDFKRDFENVQILLQMNLVMPVTVIIPHNKYATIKTAFVS